MPVPLAIQPPTPLDIAMAPLCSLPVQLTSNVTLSTPTSATLITGLSASVTIPQYAQYLRIFVQGGDATVTAAATVTLAAYYGATSGTLTTQVGSSVVVAPTGGTTVAVNSIFYIPVTAVATPAVFPNATATAFISIAATASTGNFVLNASSTSPTTFYVDCI